MVQVGVDVVDTNGVDTQNLHQSSITKAVILVAERVDSGRGVVASRATGLVCDSHDLEAVTSGIIDEERALHVNGGDGGGQRGGANEASNGSLNLAKVGQLLVKRYVPVMIKRLLGFWRRCRGAHDRERCVSLFGVGHQHLQT